MDAKKVIEEAIKNAAAPAVVAVTDEEPADPTPPGGNDAEERESEGGDGEGVKEEDVVEAVRLFLKGPKWRKIYDDAPENAKNRIALNFYWSACKDKPGFDRAAYLSLRNRLEEMLKWDDVVYMISMAQNDLAKKHYRRLLSSLKDEEETDKGSGDGDAANADGVAGNDDGKE